MTTQTRLPTAAGEADSQRTALARLYIEQLRVFYVHAMVFAASMVGIFMVNLLTNISANITGEWWAWWSAWALIGWGLGIAIHGLVVRISRPQSSGSSWEEQQINKLLSSDDAELAR